MIELLVVVLIIGILAAIAVPQYQKSVAKARFVQAETATKMIQEAQGLFYLANGKYAEDLDQLAVSFPKENEREFKFEQTSCSIVAQAYVMCVAFSPKISFYRYYVRVIVYNVVLMPLIIMPENRFVKKKRETLLGQVIVGNLQTEPHNLIIIL